LSVRGTPSETKVTIRYSNPAAAEAIMRAITPDNLGAPDGTNIEARVDGSTLIIFVVSSGSLGSLVSTLDDLISCVQAAEAALNQL
jgi:hypothetical protein